VTIVAPIWRADQRVLRPKSRLAAGDFRQDVAGVVP